MNAEQLLKDKILHDYNTNDQYHRMDIILFQKNFILAIFFAVLAVAINLSYAY